MKLNRIVNNELITCDFNKKFEFSTTLFVAGLGTAGAVCFYTAKKQGLDVIGIEKSTFLGGTGVNTCVQSYYYGDLSGELVNINKNAQTKNISLAFTHPSETAISLNQKTVELEKQSENILLDCLLTGAILDENKLVGVEVFYKNEFLYIQAKYFVDNTDGLLSRLAGAAYCCGRADGNTMNCSKTIAFLREGKINGEWNALGFLDNLDDFEYSKKLLENETKPPFLLEKYTENDRAVFEGTQIGKRETARIQTESIISFDDLVNFKSYEKPIFYGFSAFDNVNRDLENESDNLIDWIVITYMRHCGFAFSVPLESLIVKGFENLLVIGKSLGVTHSAAAAIRMKAEMEKSGEAAAYIVKTATEFDCEIKNIPYENLKQKLEKSGCLKPLEKGFFKLRKNQKGNYIKIKMPKAKCEIKDALSSKTPHYALLEIKLHAEKYREFLYEFLQSDNELLKENSAIALGLIGDKKAIPYLREIINAQPEVIEVFNGKHYYGWLEKDIWSNFVKAICLLGRFKDEKSVLRLEEIANTKYCDELSSLRVNQFSKTALKRIKL